MKNWKSEIILRYKNEKEEIRIFGDKFAENNKNNCKIIYNGKEEELKVIIKKENDKKNFVEIKLRIFKDIINMSCMFSNCKSLSSLPDISKWNTNNVNNMSEMFSGCSSLSSFPDISKWNISNVNFKNWMFDGCLNCVIIPSKFN